jgi:hypothetical protein
MIFDDLNCPKLCGVLLGMSGLSEHISNKVLPVEIGHLCSGLDLGVVSPEDARCSFFPDEMHVCLWHFAFRLHTKYIYHVGLHPIKDLGTCCTANGLHVGKVYVIGHHFPQAIAIEPWNWALI